MKANRISASAALVFTTLTLGLSCWAVACGSAGTPAPAPAPSPSACAPAVATVAEVRSASPEAGVAPVVTAEPKVASRPVAPNAQIAVKRLVLTRTVKAREPGIALAQVEAGDSQLYAFVEVDNQSAEDGAIVISFEKKGTRTGNIELKVPANQNRWRTWGWTRGVREPGQWSVVVRSLGGRELARTAFEAS